MFITFDVFGKPMAVLRKNEEWQLFLDSGTGLRSRIYDVVIPADLAESELDKYLADIFHENAKGNQLTVSRIK
ncbi:hypothetical protein [Shewanella sp. WPAGA9]|uniref:DUF7661 family protein n=1 Tax=Shewanella sp. ENK2 TaxID=2775245 RepID=UPI001781F943|nr:hypothetical protein [Shewanella sp. WPAGA9]